MLPHLLNFSQKKKKFLEKLLTIFPKYWVQILDFFFTLLSYSKKIYLNLQNLKIMMLLLRQDLRGTPETGSYFRTKVT